MEEEKQALKVSFYFPRLWFIPLLACDDCDDCDASIDAKELFPKTRDIFLKDPKDKDEGEEFHFGGIFIPFFQMRIQSWIQSC